MASEDVKYSTDVRIKEEPGSDSQIIEPDGSTNSSSAGTSNNQEAVTRQISLQRIQQRKQKVYRLPKNQKMAKLAMYSACQFPECRCINWKTPEENRHRDVESNYCPQFTEECRNPGCKHSLG